MWLPLAVLFYAALALDVGRAQRRLEAACQAAQLREEQWLRAKAGTPDQKKTQ